MAKEKDIFGGFDLFNPTAGRLKTPNPEEAEITDIPVESSVTKEEKDRKVIEDQELNIPGSFDKEAKLDKKAEVKTEKKEKSSVKTPDTEAVKETSKEGVVKEEKPTVKEEPVVEEAFSFKPLISYLGDKGIVDLEDGEIEKLTDDEEALEGVISKTITKNISEGINDWKESYNPEIQELLKFVELGGKPKDFYDVYYGNTSFENLKIDTEDNQKFVIRQGLKLSGWEDAEIEEELKDYEDLGKLETKASTHLKKLQVYEKSQKENLIKAQEENNIKTQETNKQYWNNLREELFKKEDIQGFKINQKEKEQLWDYMSTPDRKTGKTKLQEHNETNKDAQWLYAYLAKNNWDISKLERDVKTKVTSELRKNLGKFTDDRNKLSGARDNAREKTNEDNDPFGGFDKLKIK